MKAPKSSAPRKPARKAALVIPPILLEGDHPADPAVGGPGEKFALGTGTPAEPIAAQTAPLPEAYGTQRLVLTVRDPHVICAHWDLTRAQQAGYNSRAADRRLVLRVYTRAVTGPPVSEIQLHPESRHWFVHVEQAGASFTAELGYYDSKRHWVRVTASNRVTLPPGAVATGGPVRFATIRPELPLPQLTELGNQTMYEYLPAAGSLEELPASAAPGPPFAGHVEDTWTSDREHALAEIIHAEDVRHVGMGSLEIIELIRRRREPEAR